ncbi:sigma-70 factor domain-containing protein, partial [Klebsiella pneumoniae]|uniref:sigma-70 factor domain-containing protein n=1 Tax=Klebsiella pneumoniae TaxID=573 RepID=UPI0029F4A48F
DDVADQSSDLDDDDDDEADHATVNLLEAIESDDTVGLYLKEIGRVPLLTAPQEVDLAQRMERGKAARESLPTGKLGPEEYARTEHLIED